MSWLCSWKKQEERENRPTVVVIASDYITYSYVPANIRTYMYVTHATTVCHNYNAQLSYNILPLR